MIVRNFVGALAVAVLLALPLVKPAVGHVDMWKIELGVAGLIVFLRAGLTKA